MSLVDAITAHITHTPNLAPLTPLIKATRRKRVPQKAWDTLRARMEAAEALNIPVQDTIKAALRPAIEAAARAGALHAPTSPSSHTIFEDAWKDVVSKPWDSLPAYRQDHVLNGLVRVLMQPLYAKPRVEDAGRIAATITQAIATGTIAPTQTPRGDDLFTNHADGEAVVLAMDAWTPSFGREGSKDALLPPTKMPPEGRALMAPLDFPSGRLLVSDTIAVGSFHKATLDVLRQGGIQINYAWHRLARTKVLMTALHLFDTHTGSDGPGLVQGADGALYGARPTEDFPAVASICHDYWGTRIIDRAHLAAFLVAHQHPDPQGAIDAWLDSSDHHTEVVVPAGTWYAVWADDDTSVAQALGDVGVAAPVRAHFALLPHRPDSTSDSLIFLDPALRHD